MNMQPLAADIMESTEIRILPVPVDMVANMWPYIGPHLAKGAEVDPDFDISRAADLVAQGLTQIWAIWRGPHIVAALCTTFVSDDDKPGEIAMDIHGLGGNYLTEWIETLCDLMLEWATANKAHRIIFRGRKCLARAYKPLGKIECRGQLPDGTYLFERNL